MYGEQQDLMSGFRPTLQQYAMQHQSNVLDLPGKLPPSSIYIDPNVVTQPTGSYNPMPVSQLPLHELGLGIQSATGQGGASPFAQPGTPGAMLPGGQNMALLEEQQKEADKAQTSAQNAAIGSTAGYIIGSFIPIPGANVVLGALGGLVGGMFS